MVLSYQLEWATQLPSLSLKLWEHMMLGVLETVEYGNYSPEVFFVCVCVGHVKLAPSVAE